MDNVHYVVQEIIDPSPWNLPSRGFLSERHIPRNFRNFPSWLARHTLEIILPSKFAVPNHTLSGFPTEQQISQNSDAL